MSTPHHGEDAQYWWNRFVEVVDDCGKASARATRLEARIRQLEAQIKLLESQPQPKRVTQVGEAAFVVRVWVGKAE